VRATRQKKLTRKERERARHRREILEAAERVFVRKGYHQATVEEIAQEAEFAVGTIYNFFEGKEDLYARVVEKIAEDFMRQFETEVLTQEDPEDAIGALIALRLSHFEEHRGFFKVFLETSTGGVAADGMLLPKNCLRLYDQYTEAVSKIFERGMKAGLVEKMDPLYATLCLEGIINAFVAYWSGRKPAEPLATRVQKLRDAFMGRLRTNSTSYPQGAR